MFKHNPFLRKTIEEEFSDAFTIEDQDLLPPPSLPERLNDTKLNLLTEIKDREAKIATLVSEIAERRACVRGIEAFMEAYETSETPEKEDRHDD